MGLGIYRQQVASSNISDDGSFDNPLSVTVDGKLGGIFTSRLYIRNDDPAFSYIDISVVPVDSSTSSVVDGSQVGFSWKLKEGDQQPTSEEWVVISAGNTASLRGAPR